MPVVRQVPSITHAAAAQAIAAALAYAGARGWRVAAAVCDAAGGLVAFGRLDGTSQPIGDFAMDKAFTAATFGKPTTAFAADMASDPSQSAGLSTRKRLITWQGGLPIQVDGATVGAIGVSGVTGPQDEECAEVGIAAIAAVK